MAGSLLRAIIIVFAMLCASVLAAKESGGSAAKAKGEKRFADLQDAYEQEDCPKVIKTGAIFLEKPDQFPLADKALSRAYDLVVTCELHTNLLRPAYRHALAGTQLDASSDALWMTRLSLDIDRKDFDASVATVEAMTEGRGRALILSQSNG